MELGGFYIKKGEYVFSYSALILAFVCYQVPVETK